MEPKLTTEQLARLIQEAKPYLIELERRVRSLDYGTVTVKLEVRAQAVEKMVFISEEQTWLRPKEGH